MALLRQQQQQQQKIKLNWLQLPLIEMPLTPMARNKYHDVWQDHF